MCLYNHNCSPSLQINNTKPTPFLCALSLENENVFHNIFTFFIWFSLFFCYFVHLIKIWIVFNFLFFVYSLFFLPFLLFFIFYLFFTISIKPTKILLWFLIVLKIYSKYDIKSNGIKILFRRSTQVAEGSGFEHQ